MRKPQRIKRYSGTRPAKLRERSVNRQGTSKPSPKRPLFKVSLPPLRMRHSKRAPAPEFTQEDLEGTIISAIKEADDSKQAEMSFLQRRAKRLRESWVVVGLEALGLIGLMFAAGIFVFEMSERQKEAVARAWQLVTTQAPGNSGKIEALEYLNDQYFCLPRAFRTNWCWKKRTSLTGVNLSTDADVPSVFLSEIDLGRAILTEAELSNIDFSFANLRYADLSGADLGGANLYQADLRETALFRTDFRDANLRGTDLRRIQSIGGNFSSANLTNADLREATLSGSDFSQANLATADLRAIVLVETSFDNARLNGANLSGVYLREIALRDVNLSGADLTGADLNGVDLTGSYLSDAKLIKANLGNAKLRNVVLFDADLSEADLSGTDLLGADLRGANLSGANMKDTALSIEAARAISEKTIGAWAYEDRPPANAPEGFFDTLHLRKRGEARGDFNARIRSKIKKMQQ